MQHALSKFLTMRFPFYAFILHKIHTLRFYVQPGNLPLVNYLLNGPVYRRIYR